MAQVASLALSNGANALTAKDISDNMTSDEQTAYVSGVVEGLAYARWLADGKDATGMQCIWDWFLKSDQEELFNARVTWFDRHPDQQVSTLMYVLIKKECGE